MGSMTRWTKIGRSWSNVSNTPYRLHKVDTHKGGSCTPLIAYWPKGIKGENRISHEPGHFIDIMPTLVEATGADYPTIFDGQDVIPMQGRSLMPIFQQKKPADRGAVFWDYSRGKGVRFGKWRLVSDNNEPWCLYDMTVDKTETNDLVKEFPEIARKLEVMYLDWMKSTESL